MLGLVIKYTYIYTDICIYIYTKRGT